jgi:Fic family protein
MVSVRKKKIRNTEYLYAEHSFRLPNNKIKKISKLIKNKEDINKKEIKEYFLKKEIEESIKVASKYTKDRIFIKEKISNIEKIKTEYKYLTRNLTKKQMKDIIDRFTVNFTYESNAIEGNSLTLKDVTMVLSENMIPKGSDLRDIYETKNTRKANDLLFNKNIKITVKDIIKIHSTLVDETGVTKGFKKLPNFLLMKNIKTTLPENVENDMNELIRWYDQNQNLHPLRLASEFHARFEKIHPFEDGNGRVGRMLINAILMEKGYPPLIIKKTMRQSYFNALEAYDYGHKDKLERFLIEKLEDTFKNFFEVYVKYI